jgi:hypothetical protein
MIPSLPTPFLHDRCLHDHCLHDHCLHDDDGMSTVEYAIGTIAAAAFAAVLYAVVSGESIVTALTTLVQRALTATF